MSQKDKMSSDVRYVDIESIKPNSYNPNDMDDEQFDSLVEDIRENGIVGQPIIINKNNEIVDGEHRWRALRCLHYEKVPVVYFNPKDEDHQKMLTIGWNAKRGEMSSLKLAEIVQDLNKRHSLGELSKKLGFNQTAVKDLLSQAQVSQEFIDKINKEAKEKSEEVPVVMTFAVDAHQEKIINDALDFSIGKSRGEKLLYICDTYLSEKPVNENNKEK